jgi:hypothetical protein
MYKQLKTVTEVVILIVIKISIVQNEWKYQKLFKANLNVLYCGTNPFLRR